MPLAGREIVDGNLDRMVAPGPSHHLSAACNFYKIAAFGNFHAHFGWSTGGVHITRPQKNRVRARLAAGNIMGKSGKAKQRLGHSRAAGQHQPANTKSSGCKQKTAVD